MQELLDFITIRMQEIERLTRSLSVSETPSIQAAVDQLERLTTSVKEVLAFVQHYPNSPLGLPLLRKIAKNWSYHPDFENAMKGTND